MKQEFLKQFLANQTYFTIFSYQKSLTRQAFLIIDKMSISKLHIVLGAPDRVNIIASCMIPVSVKKMLE